MNQEYLKSARVRFEERYAPVTESGCWLWTAGKDKDGYGRMYFNRQTDMAHRVSYALFNGKLKRGDMVLHKCDVTACVNPAHLYIGTPQDNMNDKMSRGRHKTATPEQASKKLTHEDVKEIRRLVSEGAVQRRVAEGFNVSYSTICRIINNVRWKSHG